MQKITQYVLGFITDGHRVLLIKKNRPENQVGLYNGIGGKVNDNELPLDAMIRESKEETNLDGAVGDFYEAIQDDYVHKRTVQVVMYLKNITGDVSISDEHDNWMWANLEKIKTLELSTAFEKVLKKKNWKI